MDNAPIRWAALSGHYDIVKLLLTIKGVDPTDDENYAIEEAMKNKHVDIVKLLLNDERVWNSLSRLQMDEIEEFLKEHKV